MNKTELIQALSAHTEFSQKDVSKFIDGFCEVVSKELTAGNEVALVGFGTFKVGDRAERPGRHPRSGEAITIPATRTAKFSIGKTLKDRVAAGSQTNKTPKKSDTVSKKK